MNHKQWEALKEAVQGHAPGPWRMCWDDGQIRDGAGYCVSTNEAHNAKLSATAPDLLAEVERLRGHFARLRNMVDPDSDLACAIDSALDGAEVPK